MSIEKLKEQIDNLNKAINSNPSEDVRMYLRQERIGYEIELQLLLKGAN